MQQNPLDHANPQTEERSRHHEPFAFGWINFAAAGGFVVAVAWHLVIASGVHSNRDFGKPAMLLSIVLSVYGFLRLRFVPLVTRLICFPVALIVICMVFGMLMILAAP